MDMHRMQCYRFLTQDDWRLLEEKSVRQVFQADAEIFREGMRTSDLLILRSGSVRIEMDHRGEPLELDRLFSGEFVGIMSFLDDAPVNVSVVTNEQTEVDYLDAITMHALLISVPGFSTRFYLTLAVILAQRLREMREKMQPPFQQDGN